MKKVRRRGKAVNTPEKALKQTIHRNTAAQTKSLKLFFFNQDTNLVFFLILSAVVRFRLADHTHTRASSFKVKEGGKKSRLIAHQYAIIASFYGTVENKSSRSICQRSRPRRNKKTKREEIRLKGRHTMFFDESIGASSTETFFLSFLI